MMGANPPPAAPPPGLPAQSPQPGGMMHPMAPGQAMTPQVGQAPISPEKMKLLELPTWEEVEALLKNPILREFRLDIETDSTIKMDEDAEKAARVELITAVGGFIQQAIAAGASAPEILPMLGELLMFGIRAFKTARSVEQTFEDMMQALEKAAKQPKPDPEIAKIQAQTQSQMQIAQVKAQTDKQIADAQQAAQNQQVQAQLAAETQRDQAKAHIDAQTEQAKEQIQGHYEQAITDLKNRFEAQRVQFETQAKERMAQMDNAVKIQVAKIQADAAEKQQKAQHKHEKSMPQPKPAAKK